MGNLGSNRKRVLRWSIGTSNYTAVWDGQRVRIYRTAPRYGLGLTLLAVL